MMNALREPQRIAVFGGTSDIGLAIAQEFPAPATHVCLIGRDAQSLATSAAQIARDTITVSTHVCDAVNLSSHEQAIAEVFASEVDVVVIAAGVLVGGDPAEALDSAVTSLEVNGTGTSSWLLRCYARLRAQGHGSLVVLSSFAVARPRPSNWVYGAGKAMIDFAARGLMAMHTPGVDVILVRPGFVHSKMTQGKPVAPFAVKPSDVARVTARAVRAGGSSVVWVPGVVKHVARLMSVLPLSLVRRLDR